MTAPRSCRCTANCPSNSRSRSPAARPARPSPRRARHQRRRIQRHPAGRARGDRQRTRARAALRPQQRLLAAGRRRHRAGLGRPARRPRGSRRRRLGIPAVAAVAAAGAAAAAPKSRRSNSPALALELAAWGSDDLRFVDPPPAGALAAARDLLQRLGALDRAHAITALGRRMLSARHASAAGGDAAARRATMRRARWPAISPRWSRRAIRCARSGGARSDALAARWQALAAFRTGRVPHEARRSALAAIDAAAKQWRRRLRVDAMPPRDAPAHALGDLLAHAFPDRIAHQHAADPRRYQLANGRMARLFDDSALFGEPWLVAAELRFEARDALILRAAPVDEAAPAMRISRRIFPTATKCAGTRSGARWSPMRVRRFDGIVLDSRPAGRVDPDAAAQALTDAVRELGLDALPWTRCAACNGARACAALRAWMPELALPDLVRRRAARRRSTTGCARPSPARPGSMR